MALRMEVTEAAPALPDLAASLLADETAPARHELSQLLELRFNTEIEIIISPVQL